MDAPKGKGKGKASWDDTSKTPAKGGGKGGKGKAKGKGGKSELYIDPKTIDEFHMPYISAFKYQDGTAVDRVLQVNDDATARGLVVGDAATHMPTIFNLKGATTLQDKAYLLFGRIKDMNIADTDDIMTSYHAVQIEVPIARNKA